ncbi:MAG: primosomal protein N' [Chloroflexota bacterium]
MPPVPGDAGQPAEHGMRYAEVSVNSPIARRRTFSYEIPPGLSIDVGDAVWVPFGAKVLQGVVLELSSQPAVEQTREIAGFIDRVLSPHQTALARWISSYYLSPLFDAVALMLPPGFERKPLTFLEAAARPDRDQELSPEQRELLELVRGKGPTSPKEIEKRFGKKKAVPLVSQLVRQGWLSRSYRMEPVKIRAKTELRLHLLISPEAARREAERLRGQRAARQAALLELLAQAGRAVPLAEARKTASPAIARALKDKGLVAVEQAEVRREPFAYSGIAHSTPPTLTSAQKAAVESIGKALLPVAGRPSVFLLHGVTGSGKTEVYLQSLAEAVRLGKRGIVLVPEIALTPQTLERFAARFPGRVGVLHSSLSPGEQFDEWHRISNGDFDVVIGPRSAIFAPQPQLGLIVIDEEHEWTYKQADRPPRYDARTVALKLSELIGATVVMGSATPGVETFYHAQAGDYQLLTLPERVVPYEGASLPHVDIVDLREELKAGNRSIFSRPLAEATARAVAGGEQVILFLNRRGGATTVQCRNCGFVLRCRRCELPLTQDIAGNVLTCHQCAYKTAVPQTCPQCSSRRIKFLGIGTQKLEQETGYAFPGARRLRWDSDTTRGKNAHGRILSSFRSHQADILIGTQMVAKGLDLPAVTLVGVVSADVSLNLPDFRAGERTFQLISQVAGRAGRGASGGRVIIQTYSPEHYAVQAAARHDYTAFYDKEIAYRRQLLNPPFRQLALLLYTHTNEAQCQKEAERMKDLLTRERDARGIAGLGLIGPAPAFLRRVRGRFRWQLILRGFDLPAFLEPVPFPAGWTVDIDPVSLL